MMTTSCLAARFSSSMRRSSGIVTVVGNWWLGVVKTMSQALNTSLGTQALFIDGQQRHI